MNRRNFLKAIGVLAAYTVLPPTGKIYDYSHFNPRFSYGDYKPLTTRMTEDIREEIMACFDGEIAETIPKRYRRDIVWKFVQPKLSSCDPLARVGFVSWKYVPRWTL